MDGVYYDGKGNLLGIEQDEPQDEESEVCKDCRKRNGENPMWCGLCQGIPLKDIFKD